MADINNAVLYSQDITYTITYTKERPNNSQMTYHFNISALLASGASLIVGNALLCTITIAGTSSQVRIKEEQFFWDGGDTRVRNVSVTCSSSTGGTNQTVTFKVESDGMYATSSGVINNSSYTVTSSPLLTTACSPPTSCSLDMTVAETEATLSWSGAASGVNNVINAYEVEYSDSSNNSTWGSWAALSIVNISAAFGSISVSPPTTRGYYRRFRIRTRGSAGATYYSTWLISSNSVRKNIAPNKPTSVIASPSTYIDEDITVSWSGASGGTSAIKGYMIAARHSSDNSTWSAWEIKVIFDLASTSGSRDITPIYGPGIYMQYGVWTIDAFDIYSSEQVGNSVFCGVTACEAPTSCTLSITLAEDDVTLSWSGASGGIGNDITAYEVEYSDSANNVSWGAWTALSIVNTSTTSGNLSVSPPSTRGNYRRFRVRTHGTIGEVGYSGWTISDNSVRRKRLTPSPTVTAPKDGSITYNPSPRVLITTDIEPDGQLQIIEVKIDVGEWLNSVDNAELFSVDGALGDNTKTVYTGATLSTGGHTVKIRCYDSATRTRGVEVTRSFAVLTPSFEEITPNVTKVKAMHIISLRTALDNIRGYYALPTVNWGGAVIAGKTYIKNWPFHIFELRSAAGSVISLINDFENEPEVAWLPIGQGRPRADVMNQLQDLISML